jgi:ABC-2 type transport system ATP-binding protein
VVFHVLLWHWQEITFKVKKEELFGLMGSNRAGKTTTMKILTILLSPSGGKAEVLGMDLTKDVYEIRRRIGVVFGGERGLYNRVSAVDNLRYFTDLYGVEPDVSKRRIPELLFLDEPTIGLDLGGIQDVRKMITYF